MTEQRTGQLAGEIEFFSYRAVELFAQLIRSIDFLAFENYIRKPVRSILVGLGILAELGMIACYLEFVCTQNFHANLYSEVVTKIIWEATGKETRPFRGWVSLPDSDEKN